MPDFSDWFPIVPIRWIFCYPSHSALDWRIFNFFLDWLISNFTLIVILSIRLLLHTCTVRFLNFHWFLSPIFTPILLRCDEFPICSIQCSQSFALHSLSLDLFCPLALLCIFFRSGLSWFLSDCFCSLSLWCVFLISYPITCQLLSRCWF